MLKLRVTVDVSIPDCPEDLAAEVEAATGRTPEEVAAVALAGLAQRFARELDRQGFDIEQATLSKSPQDGVARPSVSPQDPPPDWRPGTYL